MWPLPPAEPQEVMEDVEEEEEEEDREEDHCQADAAASEGDEERDPVLPLGFNDKLCCDKVIQHKSKS